jgi:hemoglobin
MEPTLYEEMGGAPFFEKLVAGFYEGIKTDPVLKPMYPEEDLAGAIDRLTMFLSQYWGGPTDYSEQRGHPRLRMRHNAFPINGDARDRWLTHMSNSLAKLEIEPHLRDQLWTYLVTAAHSLVNLPDN